MYISKSFCSLVSLIQNQKGEDNAVGELSAHSRTFTKNLGMYHDDDYRDFDIENFLSDNGGAHEVLTKALVSKIASLVQLCWQKTQSSIGQPDRTQLLQDLITFGGSNQISSIAIGALTSDGRYWLPEYIRFVDDSDERENQSTVWLADFAFRRDYDNYIIDVVPIVDRIDDFFLPAAQVKTFVDAVKTNQIMERLDAAAKGKPATYRSAEEYEYVDPTNSANRFDVPWPANIYTDIGYDSDLIKDSIVEHILANSSRPRADWEKIFPDLFKRTEFVYAPWWNKYAAGARSFDHGVHSPVVDTAEILPWIKKWAVGYSEAHVNAVTQVTGFAFRSVVAAIVGSVQNRDMKHRLTDIYPDYMNLPTSDPDAARMSVETVQYVLRINQMLALAEEWDGASALPAGILRVRRGDYTFLSTSINRITHLVLTKQSVIDNP